MDATSNFSFRFAQGSESLTTVDPSAHDPIPERAPLLQPDISRTISVVYHDERTEDLLDQPALSPDGEERDTWLRGWDRQKPSWTALTPEEWDTMAAHVHAADFPEMTSRWHSMGHEAGFREVRELFVAPTGLIRMYCFKA
jgi:hypothetical protein